jgi:hypothetical protein
MNDVVEDGIGEGRLADEVMPGLDGQLAGDHGRATAISLLDDLHQIAALRCRQPVWSTVIQDQQKSFRDAAEQAGEAPVAMGQFQFPSARLSMAE